MIIWLAIFLNYSDLNRNKSQIIIPNDVHVLLAHIAKSPLFYQIDFFFHNFSLISNFIHIMFFSYHAYHVHFMQEQWIWRLYLITKKPNSNNNGRFLIISLVSLNQPFMPRWTLTPRDLHHVPYALRSSPYCQPRLLNQLFLPPWTLIPREAPHHVPYAERSALYCQRASRLTTLNTGLGPISTTNGQRMAGDAQTHGRAHPQICQILNKAQRPQSQPQLRPAA